MPCDLSVSGYCKKPWASLPPSLRPNRHFSTSHHPPRTVRPWRLPTTIHICDIIHSYMRIMHLFLCIIHSYAWHHSFIRAHHHLCTSFIHTCASFNHMCGIIQSLFILMCTLITSSFTSFILRFIHMCTSFIHMYTSSIHICDIIHSCVHIIHLYVHHTFTCVNHCGIIFICAHHSFLCPTWLCETDTSLLIQMCVCVCMCACVSRCVRVWVQHQSETMTRVYCVFTFSCVRVYTFSYVCVSVYLFVAGDPPHAQVMIVHLQMWKVHKINIREMGKDPSPPSEVFSRNGLLSSLSSCCCYYCHTHTRASTCTCSHTCTRRTF